MNAKIVADHFFSIIIPVYNASAYLEDCLESILHQSFPDWEAIFINDGSTDDSAAIIEKAMSDPRIRLTCYDTNRGPSYARNRGLELARAPWIVLLDADDWMADSRLSYFHNLIMSHSEYQLLADQYAFVADKEFWIFPNLHFLPREIYIRDFIRHNLGSLQPVISRSFLLDNSIEYDEKISFSEDFDLIIKIFFAGARFYLDDTYTYYRRARDDSLSRTTENHYSVVQNLAKQYIPMFDDRRIRNSLKMRVASSRFDHARAKWFNGEYLSAIRRMLSPHCIAVLMRTITRRLIFGNRYRRLRPLSELLPVERGRN